MTQAIPLHSLNHVSRETRDVNRLKDFYMQVLGFRPAVRPNFSFGGHWLMLPVGYHQDRGDWHLTPEGRPTPGALLMHIIQKDEAERLPEGPVCAVESGVCMSLGHIIILTTSDEPSSSFPDRPKAILRGHHLAFRTQHMEQVEKILAERGIECGRAVVPNTKVRQLFFFDPDGNGIEVGEFDYNQPPLKNPTLEELSGGPVTPLSNIYDGTKPLDVGIVGGSLTGLAAALALTKLGAKVTVYERAAESRRRGGGGIGVEDDTRQILLTGLNVDKKDLSTILLPMRVQSEVDRNGRTIRESLVPFWSAYWQDLDDLLLRYVTEEKVRYHHMVVDLKQKDDKVTLTFKDGSNATHDVVLGCDGGASSVRGLLFPEHQMRYSGYVAWRGTIKLPEISEELSAKILAEFPKHILHFKMSGKCHLVFYYLPGKIINWIVYVPEGESRYVNREEAAKVLTKDATEEEIKEFREKVSKIFPSSSIIDVIEHTSKPYKNQIYDNDPLPVYNVGRILLLGDSAHYSTPHLVRGSNMAVQDGYWVARVLYNVVLQNREEGDVVKKWFEGFEVRRRDITTEIAMTSRNLGRVRQGLVDNSEDWDIHCTSEKFSEMAKDSKFITEELL